MDIELSPEVQCLHDMAQDYENLSPAEKQDVVDYLNAADDIYLAIFELNLSESVVESIRNNENVNFTADKPTPSGP